MSRIVKFREDERGVTAIIGAVLMLMILMMVYTSFQVYQVPAWNKGVEYEHMNVVYDDMMSLKSDIENVAMLETPKSSNIHLGVKYPERMIFTNPGVGVAGMLSTDTENMKIVIDYTLNTTGSPTFSRSYNSTRIIYEAYGTINSPKLVYEHGIIIRDWETANITMDEQSLIANDKLYIPIVHGSSSSTTSMETKSLEIKPYTEISAETNVTSINITMDTNYPEIWRELLADANTSSITTFVSEDNRIIINCTSSAMRNITFPTGLAKGTINAGFIKPPGPKAYIEKLIKLAEDIGEDVSGVVYSGNGTKLENITLTNTGAYPIIIESIRVSWVPDNGEKIKFVKAKNAKLDEEWKPNGEASSGTWLYPQHGEEKRIFIPGESIKIRCEFDENMSGKEITIDFLLSDYTIKTIIIEVSV